MKKLLELLNEYIPKGWSIEHGGKSVFYEGLNYNDRIIGKDFGFIKWLVENDKINKDIISRVLIRAYVSPKNHISLECEFYDYYESLLMLLSIQNEPIEFLISILKNV